MLKTEKSSYLNDRLQMKTQSLSNRKSIHDLRVSGFNEIKKKTMKTQKCMIKCI